MFRETAEPTLGQKRFAFSAKAIMTFLDRAVLIEGGGKWRGGESRRGAEGGEGWKAGAKG